MPFSMSTKSGQKDLSTKEVGIRLKQLTLVFLSENFRQNNGLSDAAFP